MGKSIRWCLAVSLCAASLRAQEPIKAPAAPTEVWEAAYLDGFHVGHYRTTFQNVDLDAGKAIRSRQALLLKVRRYGQTVELRMTTGTDETADGKVVGIFMDQFAGAVVMTGVVKDGMLHIEVNPRGLRRQVPWNDKVIGLRAQENLFRGKKLKAGEEIAFGHFEPSVMSVMTIRATPGEEEEIDLPGGKRKLIPVVLASDPLRVGGREGERTVRFPAMTQWLDAEGNIVRREVQIDGLGKLLLVRTTREVADARIDPDRLPDIGLRNLLTADRKIPRFNATLSAVYRITLTGDEKPETAFVSDARQEVKPLEGGAIELHVTALLSPPESSDEKPASEFLESCYYLDSDDAKVKQLAREAVGDETDPWFRARRIEGWVKRNLTIDEKTPFGRASQTAKDLRGDCRQCAMLTAAMCRAAGVPSRTALGVVYAEVRGQPVFGFHMWTEVWVRGRWLGLDATLGEGKVGAAHIKVTDSSWHEVQSLTPLLPLQRVLGKMKIEIVRVAY